jgi:hypothetical protein
VRLEDAVIDAQPVPNMLAFYELVSSKLPQAEHVMLSARLHSMRPDTMAWLRTHGLAPADGAVCFVPSVQAKTRVWRQLVRNGQLIIVDDLSYNHEAEQVSVYDELVAVAKRIATAYVGHEEITAITAGSDAVDAVVSRMLAALAE